MARCEWCANDMTTGASCTFDALHVDGRHVELVPYGQERDVYGLPASRCGDCGVAWGGLHHLGCDLQECPHCAGQLFSCECRFDEDGPADVDDPDDPIDIVLPEVAGSVSGRVSEPFGIDVNGCFMERAVIAGVEVLIRYEDIPDSDKTTVQGIPCTTALRTLIDLAPTVTPGHLREIVDDMLTRRLFSLPEAWERLERPDMEFNVGAELVRRELRRRS